MQKEKGVLVSLLYIEDDRTNREIVKMFLRNCFAVDTASDSSEALKKISRNNYSVVLMDISLHKGLDGLELAREIKKIKNYKNVPIVAVTGHAFRYDEKRILNGGCSHYITKPFTKASLIDRINKVLAGE